MTAPAAPAIDEIRVAPVRFADGVAQTRLVARHREDVNMVGHQAAGPDLHVPPHRLSGQQIAIHVLVAVVEEDRLPATCLRRSAYACGFGGRAESQRPAEALAKAGAKLQLRAGRLPRWVTWWGAGRTTMRRRRVMSNDSSAIAEFELRKVTANRYLCNGLLQIGATARDR
jgi:hypothetical protein